jgi:DNA end-binding protein Ku
MRSIYNGAINFGLVSVPVKLYGATEEHELVSHQVHAHDGGRIKYQKVCAECSEAVSSDAIAKQFEIEGQTAILTDEDLRTLPSENNRVIEVLEFVPADSLDVMMYEKSYFAAPANNGVMKAYALLARTLEDAGKVAIARFTLRSKTRLAALGVTGKGILVLHALRWPDEIRPAVLPALDTAVLDRRRDELSDAEVGMAAQLVESMSMEGFNPDRYQDNFGVELRELVMSKLGVVEDGAEEVSGLLAMLEKSAAARAPKACKPPIREWAKARGIAVSSRGRIPQDIVDRYELEAV